MIDLLNLILELDPSVLGPVDGSKLMGDILIDLLDIDLAISEVHFVISHRSIFFRGIAEGLPDILI